MIVCNSTKKGLIVRFLMALSLFLFIECQAIAQSSDSAATASTEQKTDTAASSESLNKTQKSLFKEMKKMTKADDNTLYSVLGVIAVITVVCVAMYLSFKGGDEKK